MNPSDISKKMDNVTESSIRLVMASTFDTYDKTHMLQGIISAYDMINDVLNDIEVRNENTLDTKGIITGC